MDQQQRMLVILNVQMINWSYCARDMRFFTNMLNLSSNNMNAPEDANVIIMQDRVNVQREVTLMGGDTGLPILMIYQDTS